jgi:hypothetical protein
MRDSWRRRRGTLDRGRFDWIANRGSRSLRELEIPRKRGDRRGEPEDFAILGALFETPAMVSVEGKIASNEFTIHLEGDLGIEYDPRASVSGSRLSRLSRASAEVRSSA